MRSIVFAGGDLSDVCSAQVVGRSVGHVDVDAVRVVGRPGALPVDSSIPPEEVRVRLMMDPGFRPSANGLADLRHFLRSWLLVPGGELALPDEPELVYRDAFLTDAGDWSQLFEDGECEVTFTLYDPVAYGLSRVERTAAFEVGGTWRTWPEFALVADAGNGITVACAALGMSIALEDTFVGGETIVIDCATEGVLVNDADARDVVTLGSDFFALEPGDCTLAFTGCTYFETRFTERWL